MEKARKAVSFIIKIIVSLAIIIFIFRKFDIAKSIDAVKAFNAFLFIPILFIEISTYFLRAIKLFYLLRIENINIKFYKIFKLVFMGAFLNIFFPAGMGDIAKSYYNIRWVEGKKGRIVAINLFNRLTAIASIFFISVFSAIFFKTPKYIYLGIASLIPLMLFLSIPVIYKFKAIKLLNSKIYEKYSFDIFGVFRDNNYSFKNYFVCLLLSVIAWISTYLSLFIIFRDYTEISFLEVILKSPLLVMVKLLPISIGGLGLDEMAISYSFINNVNSKSVVLAAALIYRVIIWAAVLLGGIFVGYEHLNLKKR